MIRDSKTFRSGMGEIFTPFTYSSQSAVHRPGLTMPCQDKSMSSRAARGYKS